MSVMSPIAGRQVSPRLLFPVRTVYKSTWRALPSSNNNLTHSVQKSRRQRPVERQKEDENLCKGRLSYARVIAPADGHRGSIASRSGAGGFDSSMGSARAITTGVRVGFPTAEKAHECS